MPTPAVVVPHSIARQELDRQEIADRIPVSNSNEAYSGGISWGAVIGGAFASASLALILVALGTGLGLSALSPWSNLSSTASTVGRAAIAWLIVTQIFASALGGYLAGRLRTKWVQIHTDEVYFRDTAHGLLVWALGLVVTASLLASAATSLAGHATDRSSAATAGSDAAMLNPNAYLVDTLFRPSASAPVSTSIVAERNDIIDRGQAERILSHDLKQGKLLAADKTYLAQVVSARTGLSQPEAENRVAEVFAEAQQSAESARKALAHLSLWLFVALLSGAFCASYAGTIGGRQRDRVMA